MEVEFICGWERTGSRDGFSVFQSHSGSQTPDKSVSRRARRTGRDVGRSGFSRYTEAPTQPLMENIRRRTRIEE